MQSSAMKPCPYCGELIAASARKCRFCGELVDGPGERAPDRGDPPTEHEALQFIVPVNVSGWALVAFYGGLIGLFAPPFALVGLICGIVAVRRLKKNADYGGVSSNIRAVAGLVLSCIGVLGWSAMIVFILLKAFKLI